MTLTHVRAVLFMSLLSWIAQGNASVVVTGTRVIYPQSSSSVTVRLTNDGSQPSLVQAWVDDGNSEAPPNESPAPFVVTPPVFRMEPNAGQALRLTLTDTDLPKDKESVFWLNVLDIPPKPSKSTSNYVQLAVRTRIKIFLRPEDLNMTVDQAAGRLQWAPGSRGDVIIHNPTPFYFSLNGVSAGTGNDKKMTAISVMASPFSSVQLAAGAARSSAGTVDVSYINDFGGTTRVTVHRKTDS